MGKLKLRRHADVQAKFDRYPDHIRPLMMRLRDLILEVADERLELDELEETLKWGEPSYLAKKGSTLRMDWKEKKPDQYAMYFKCTSLLVPTFQAVFGDLFKYEGHRAIVFDLEEEVPEEALKLCIVATLQYHAVKKMPNLGL